jgi:starch synthase
MPIQAAAPLRILHAAAECFPLAKTGGLGDVAAALPAALRPLGDDARVALPAYPGVRERLGTTTPVGRLETAGGAFQVLRGALGALPVYLFDCPALFDRPGTPYEDPQRVPFADNALRFGSFGSAVAQFAQLEIDGFAPDIVHLHDWQAALAAPLIRQSSPWPRIVFTIHNLAYQGHFGRADFEALQLPPEWWSAAALEYWNGFSFM